MNRTNMTSAGQGQQAWQGTADQSQFQRGSGHSRARTFNKGRGGRQRKMPPQPRAETSEVRFEIKPMYLSKTPSKEQNDPLYREAWFSDPGTELSPAAEELHIYPGCEALPVIVDAVHKETLASKQGFAKRVSHSAFAYYCAVLTYSRLLQLYRDNQNSITYEEGRFIQEVDDGHYLVPSLLSVYLSGFGNTSVPSGRELKFSLRRPAIDAVREAGGVTGWFGQVDENTHYLYKHYPCLAVFAKRIQHDLGLPVDGGQGPHANQDWNLPVEVRCEAPRCGLPTENLLGWRRSERLSHEKRDFFHSARITVDEFPSINLDVCFNMDLMHAISTELSVVERLNFLPVVPVPTGSQGQTVFDIFNRAGNIVEVRQQAVSNSLTRTLGPTTFIGGSFCYRTMHFVDEGRKVWSIYSFNNFDAVPELWTDTINTLHEDEPPEINTNRFRTRNFFVFDRIKDFLTKEVNLR